MRMALQILGWLALGVLLYGFCGRWFESADSIALLRPLAALGVLVAAIAVRHRFTRIMFAACGLVALASVAVFLWPSSVSQTEPSLRVYSKNLLALNTRIEDLAQDIRAAEPDVVMLQEVSDVNSALIEELSDELPYAHMCRFPAWIGIAVLSRTPFTAPPLCSDQRAVAAAQVAVDGREFWAVSVHIPWHWPGPGSAGEDAALRVISQLEGPVLLAGDFNSFPWTHRVRRLAAAAGGEVLGPMRPTYHLRGVPLFLDHVIAPNGGRVQTRPRIGSDHLGLVAELAF